MWGIMIDKTQNEILEILEKDRIFHTYHTVNACVEEGSAGGALSVHDWFEISLVIEGIGVHCIDRKMIPCKPGDIYVISSNTAHAYFRNSDNETLVVRKLIFPLNRWFKGDAGVYGNKHYCYGVFSDAPSVAYAMLNSAMIDKVSAIFDSIENELVDKENEWKSVVRAHLVELFAYVGRYISNAKKNTGMDEKKHDTIRAVIDIINREFSNPALSLDLISKQIYVSSSQLSQDFKLYTGKLFSEYLRETRLAHSTKLLVESEMSVEKIVTECGFRDISAFYRNFREYSGMTPQAYRRINRLSAEEVDTDIDSDTERKKQTKMEILNEISTNVQGGKSKIVKELVQKAIDEGANVEEILNDGLLAGMSVIGEKFKNNEIYVPQVLIAARAMSMGADVLKPHLSASGVEATGRVCIGTVQGDLHDIGKNLVKMMMEGKGLEVIDLGVDVPAEKFIEAAIEHNCQIICCSSLLTTTMPIMADVVKAAEAAGIRDKVKIMIGGAPVKQKFCDEIGADCYTPDAASAADAAVAFCRK